MKKQTKPTLGQRCIESLREFLRIVKSGEPVEVRKVTRYETPDGPMHVVTKEKVVLGKKGGCDV